MQEDKYRCLSANNCHLLTMRLKQRAVFNNYDFSSEEDICCGDCSRGCGKTKGDYRIHFLKFALNNSLEEDEKGANCQDFCINYKETLFCCP